MSLSRKVSRQTEARRRNTSSGKTVRFYRDVGHNPVQRRSTAAGLAGAHVAAVVGVGVVAGDAAEQVSLEHGHAQGVGEVPNFLHAGTGGVAAGFIRVEGFGRKVPESVQKEVNARQAEMAAGKLPVFAASKGKPVRDNAGKIVIAPGQALTDAQILEMNWLAEGVQGRLK